jgi:hypothetical protein
MQTVINDIARRLVKLGSPTATAAWQAQRVIESGAVFNNAIRELSRLTGMTEKELSIAFQKAGVQSIRFDDRIYKRAGLKPLPLNLSPAMVQVLRAGIEKTQGLMRNLTLTTANAAQQSFIRAADVAYLQVTSGAFSYDEAIKRAVKNVASDGLTTAISYGSGRTDQLDVAVRRAVLTGVSQTAGNLQWTRAEEMGQDLVQTSAHIGARPDHQQWQGRIFSRSGTSRRYPPFIESTGYGTATGLHGANCRHSYFPFFAGLSREIYNDSITDEYSRKTVQYQGQELKIYEATQKQRYMERAVRDWKRQANALEAAGLPNTFESVKVKEWQVRLRGFISDTGLSRQRVREQVVA